MNSERPLTSSLDLYKLTMGDLAYNKHPDAEVTFPFNNRGLKDGQRMADLVAPEMLRERFDAIRDRSFDWQEVDHLSDMWNKDKGSRFTHGYLNFLDVVRLPEVNVDIDPRTNELAISTHDKWARVSPWETVIMSEVSELHFYARMKELGLSKKEVFNEADRRLSADIALMKRHPYIQFADFGTRRRSSLEWHEHAVERWADEAPDQLIGTSNPYLAHKFGLKAIGTYAHEMPMIYAALEDAAGGNPLDGESKMLRDWEEFHRGDLLIGLPDTFTSDSFFRRLTPEQAQTWNGYRQDSGNPITFSKKLIAFLQRHDIDPRTKTVLPSDGLSFSKMIEIGTQLEGQIDHPFGIGTKLSHNMHPALPPPNTVVKATAVNGINTVKLSDDPGKHTGTIEDVSRYSKLAA